MSGDTSPSDEVVNHTSRVSYGLPTNENDIIYNSNLFTCVEINKKFQKNVEKKL